jgi:hypothetical protein
MIRGVWTALLLIVSAAVPALSGTVTSIYVTRGPGDQGRWSTQGLGWIGVTNLGDPVSNPFLGTPLEVSIPSGTYFLFFGFEDYWNTVPATIVTLTVGYLDGTSKEEVFALGSLAGPAMWSRISGDTSLFLGSTGIDYVDRMSDTAFGPNQVNDIVLEFSDTGTSGTAPEPATFGVAAGALGIVFLSRRRRK